MDLAEEIKFKIMVYKKMVKTYEDQTANSEPHTYNRGWADGCETVYSGIVKDLEELLQNLGNDNND